MTEISVPPVDKHRSIERRVTYALKILALVVLGAVALSAILAFFGRIPSVTVILVGAIFFTYVIYPAVKFLRDRMPLVAAVLLVYLLIAGIVTFGVATVAPALINDTQSLVKSSPTLVYNAQTFVSDPNNPIFARLPPAIRQYLTTLPVELERKARDYAGEAASRAVGLLASVLGLLATLVVIPVLALYLLMEAPVLTRDFIRVIPLPAQPKTLAVIHDLDNVLGGFIRGQLTVGATIGACITIALLLLHVKYAVLIGVTAGLLDVIPYVGAIAGFVPSVALALANDGWQHAVIVALVFAAIFQAEGHFIAPKIVSDSVGLTPLMVIVAILIGGELLGIGGMFLAVPLAAILRVIILHAVPNARSLQTIEPVMAATVTEPLPVQGVSITGLPVADGPPSPTAETAKQAESALT